MLILPVGSGKGGVGQSVISTNLAVALAQAGKKVVLADLDLGGSNIHTILGFRTVQNGIGTFLNNNKMKFREIIFETEYKDLYFIPGDAEIPGIANLRSHQRKRLMRNLLAVQADYLVIDLGAGTAAGVIDFFVLSGTGIIIATPTLISVLNAYLFLKNAVFTLIYSSFPRQSPAYHYLEGLRKTGTALQRIYIPKLLERLAEEDPVNFQDFTKMVARLRPRLILNMISDPKDVEKLDKLRRSVWQYLSISLEHLGVIYRDDYQDVALGSRLPIIRYKPNSVLSQAIYRISRKIIQSQQCTAEPMSLDSLEQSFRTADTEARDDFQSKLDNLEELLHCGALTTGDLVETLRSQQFEIQQLKRENQLLKSKLGKAVEVGFKV